MILTIPGRAPETVEVLRTTRLGEHEVRRLSGEVRWVPGSWCSGDVPRVDVVQETLSV